jgi:hypothetical protein
VAAERTCTKLCTARQKRAPAPSASATNGNRSRRHGIVFGRPVILLRVITELGNTLTPGPTIVATHCGAHEGLREGPREGPGRPARPGGPASWSGDALHHRPTLKHPTGPCQTTGSSSLDQSVGRSVCVRDVAVGTRGRVPSPAGGAGLYYYDRLERREVASKCSDHGLLRILTGNQPRRRSLQLPIANRNPLRAFLPSATLPTWQKPPQRRGRRRTTTIRLTACLTNHPLQR